jgi:hypothetical protein
LYIKAFYAFFYFFVIPNRKMVLILAGMGAFGAMLHITGSLLIVFGQTTVKISHCIEATSVEHSSWLLTNTHPPPQWCVALVIE